MKNILLILSLVLLNSCEDHLNELPPATQVGAKTVGALVNGKVLLPKGGGIYGNFTCFYQFVDGGYFFSLGYSNASRSSLIGLQVFTSFIQLEEGQTYVLQNPGDHNLAGGGGEYVINDDLENVFNTSPTHTGELTLTKLDASTGIIAGTFWFDAVNAEGDIVEVREGRFDMYY